MSEKSTAELERDAEATRANIADTAESIRNKMSPGQLIDEFAGLFSGDGAAALSNMKGQIRDNPLAVTMVGAGLAWLMLGQGASITSEGKTSLVKAPYKSVSEAPDFTAGGDWGSRADDQPDEKGVVGNMLSETAESVASVAGRATSAVQSGAGAVGERIRGTAGETRAAAADATQRASAAALELFQREPLAIAALGLAVGTAIGAMLPHTDLEDEQIGRYRDKVRGAAEGLLGKGIEGAKEVAAEAYQTIKDEADRQGLASDSDMSVAEKVAEVVKSATAKTEKAVRARVGATPEEDTDKTS